MKKCLILAILVTGFSGIIAQILLLRELLISFLGNELSIGIILANWLILEAFGCFFLGKKIDYIKNKILAFVGVVVIFSLSLPMAIYLTRILKEIIGISIGERVGFLPILFSSFFVLLPVSVCHGTLFTFACKIYSTFANSDVASISKVYIYETVGTIVGGIIFTTVLIPYLHSFQIAIGLAFINSLMCSVLIIPLWQTEKLQKIIGAIVIIPLILSGYFTFGNIADKLHRLSVNQQWKGHKVVHYQNSIYGNICVIQSEGGEQYTFFFDGIPTITTPIPDIIYVEEFVHLGMLTHPNPEDILVLSGGAGGVINEILKHPSVKIVDYVELDPLMMKVLKKFPTPLTETELNDPRVKIEYTDGRLFVKKTTKKYDLILVGLHEPSTLQSNRFFTKEFFHLTKNKLKKDGILVIGLPSSYAFLTEELKQLNACIINALRNVFPYVRALPGDDINLYFSSISQDIFLIEESQLIQRAKERNIKLSILIPRRVERRIERRLHPKYLEWFSETVEKSTQKINKDFQPLGLFYSISHWNIILSPYLKDIFRWFEKINLKSLLIPLSIFTFGAIFLTKRFKITNIGIPMCIATTGFAGMTFDLVLIFAFQSLYGYVFYWLGILVSSFMVGVVLGAVTMTSLLTRVRGHDRFFVLNELAIICFSFVLPVILLSSHRYLKDTTFVLQVLFLFLSFFSGFLIGSEFPLANGIYLKGRNGLGKTVGLLYASDLFGGWIAGVISGIILLPVLGLFQSCIVVTMLKISGLIGLAVLQSKRGETQIILPVANHR